MMLVREIVTLCHVHESTVYRWEKGILCGSRGYERIVTLEGRSLADVFAFIRLAWTHPSLKSIPYEVMAAAFRAGEQDVPARFLAPPSPASRIQC